MTGSVTNVCRSCGRPILWRYTAEERRMPVDPEPDGTLVLEGAWRVRAAEPLFDTGPFYRSHFATCPDAVTWRKKR